VGDTKTLDRFANKGKIDGEGYQAYSPCAAIAEHRKIIQQGTEERDQEGRHQEGEWVDIRDEDGIDGYSEHVLDPGRKWYLPVLIFAIRGEKTTTLPSSAG
jgi:hypothetical protein